MAVRGDLGRWLTLVLACLTPVAAAQRKPVYINEFLAANSASLVNSQDRYEDWIELYNPGPTSVDIGGMFLTDDLGRPDKWRIPDDQPQRTTIPADGFVLIWADNDSNDPALHANFSLSSSGEEVGLFDADGVTLVDSVAFGPQSADVSFGRYPDGGPEWGFMATPTPGASNQEAFAGCVANVAFSVAHGFYDQPFTVVLATATENAQIWYTLDGRFPSPPKNGRSATTRYDRPIEIKTTTCIRAIAVKPGWKESAVTACSYIFTEGIPSQLAVPAQPAPAVASRGPSSRPSTNPSVPQTNGPADPALREALKAIPSVCITMEPNDFSDPVTGINANPTKRGVEWERPASIEWIDPVDSLSFQVNAGLRVHGGVSRTNRGTKHSLRLVFKSQYGPSTLNAPLFKDCKVTQFDSLVLRNTMHDSWTGSMGSSPQYMRDQFSRDTMRDLGRLTPYGRPVQVYINGLYWGLFILTERPDDGFAAAHLGGSKDQYDALKAKSVSDPDPAVVEVVAGDLKAWNAMFDLADAGLEAQDRYDRMQQYLDLPSFIDYMLMVFYIGSTDGPAGIGGPPRNFWVVRPRDREGGFIFLPWDLEFSLINLNENRVAVKGTEDPHYLFGQLAANPDFRMAVADRVHQQFFHGVLTPQRSIERYLARAADIEKAIFAEAYRWEGGQSSAKASSMCAGWRTERDRIVQNYFPLRSGIVVDQLRQAGLYPTLDPPILEMNGVEHSGGAVQAAGTPLMIVNPNDGGTLYYTMDGSDPRMPRQTVNADELVMIVPADAAKRVFVPDEDIGADWTGGREPYDDAQWIAGASAVPGGGGAVGYIGGRLRDNRIGYNVGAAMAGHTSCYVRIPFQIAATDLPRLSHLALLAQCDDGFVAYLNGVEVASVNRPTPLAWNSVCVDRPGSAEPLWLAIRKDLSPLHAGENILAVHALDNASDKFFLLSVVLFGSDRAVFGEDVAPTAEEYMEPIPLTRSTPIKARAWRLGTWSALTEAMFAVGPVAQSLRITEIMYHPPEPNEEFIELANVGLETIDLNMVRFVHGIDFVFPALSLAPGEVTLVVRDRQAFTDRYGSDLRIAGQYQGALANEGEQIKLQDTIGRTILDFRYEDGWYSSTDGAGYSLECRDPFHQDPNTLSQRQSWRPSLHAGGSPGVLEEP